MEPVPTDADDYRRLLLERVRRAFASAVMPATEAELGAAIDPGWATTRRIFLGVPWDQVDRGRMLGYGTDAFYEWSRQATVYYLQSFLAAFVDRHPTADAVVELLAIRLNRDAEDGRPDFLRFLDGPQRAVVADVLEMYASDDDDVTIAVWVLRDQI